MKAPPLFPQLHGGGDDKPDVAGRMVRWAVELSEFDIQYEPRGSIKGIFSRTLKDSDDVIFSERER